MVNSKILGQLSQDKDIPDWWESVATSIPFFNDKKLPIIFTGYEPETDKEFIEEADKAIKNFLNLTVADRLGISKYVYKNCIEFLDAVEFSEADQPMHDIKDENEIWNFVHPTNIYVSRRPYKDKDMYVQIVCECDWEEEHGLQLVFRQGRQLTRVSDQDGHLTEADACGKPDDQDPLLSSFR